MDLKNQDTKILPADINCKRYDPFLDGLFGGREYSVSRAENLGIDNHGRIFSGRGVTDVDRQLLKLKYDYETGNGNKAGISARESQLRAENQGGWTVSAATPLSASLSQTQSSVSPLDWLFNLFGNLPLDQVSDFFENTPLGAFFNKSAATAAPSDNPSAGALPVSAPAPSFSLPTNNLKRGSGSGLLDTPESLYIRALQTRLQELGYLDASFPSFGYFGYETEEAVNRFKDSLLPGGNKSENRGAVGETTWKALFEGTKSASELKDRKNNFDVYAGNPSFHSDDISQANAVSKQRQALESFKNIALKQYEAWLEE